MDERERKGKNVDVWTLPEGKPLTIMQHMDVQITPGVTIRVLLCEDPQSGRQQLVTDRQVLIAYDKHVSDSISKYDLTIFNIEDAHGAVRKVVGDGNVIRTLYEEVKKLNERVEGDRWITVNIHLTTEVEVC